MALSARFLGVGKGGGLRTCEDFVGVAFEGGVDVDVVEADGG